MKKVLILILILFLSACSFDNKKNNQNESGEKHKVSIYLENDNGIVVADKELASKGEIVTLAIAPDTGFELDKIIVMDQECEENIFVMPDCDVFVYVYFKAVLYDIIVNEDIKNGTLNVSKKEAIYDEEITIEAIPDEGYKLKTIYLNGTPFNEKTFNMPNQNVLISALFVPEVVDGGCKHDYITTTLKEASCEEEGLLEYYCNACGDAYTETVEKTGHDYKNDICNNCGKELEKTYLHTLFGNDIDIYTNNEKNPYNINLNEYGSDVMVYFYEPNTSLISDPYTNVNKTTFYASYERATTYEDAYYRTRHYLMSGDITDQEHLPGNSRKTENNIALRATTATYVLDTDGDYLAYVPNTPKGEEYIIFYGAAYTSMNDVAAYLLAFGETPANQIADKDDKSGAVSLWGKYGRVNDSYFSGDTSKYRYEPELPNIKNIRYNEMDFGTIGGFTLYNKNTSYSQKAYNNGSYITRSTCRMVYVSDWNVKNIDERYVFYTYNHYNDFQEYLNYHDGWGFRFGNESKGNGYCYNDKDYDKLNCTPPTPYIETILKKYSEIQK